MIKKLYYIRYQVIATSMKAALKAKKASPCEVVEAPENAWPTNTKKSGFKIKK